MRLDKFLCHMGKGSRMEVKKAIAKGVVKVNGDRVNSGKLQINPQCDSVTYYDKLVLYRPFVYLMLNKPAGYVSARQDNRFATVLDLVPKEYMHYNLFPVGRLDKDTEGLLLLTNDGPLSHALLLPKKHVAKVYRVTCASNLDDKAIDFLRKGVVIEGGHVTRPAQVRWVNREQLIFDLTITEGKYHQVKQMLQAVDNRVVFLERVCFANLKLDENLTRGDMRLLTDKEIAGLRESTCA